MTAKAYYNENDPFCAHWLYNLIQAKLIAPGDIDTRDIRDVRPSDLKSYTQHHFFAGIGGWSAALRLAAWPDHREVWTGSCPCQPFSAAGRRRGFADERHLWPSWHWLIGQCGPATIFGEQVARASDWLGLVRGDLEAMGYAVGCLPVEAASAGADHLRDRYWFVAHGQRRGCEGRPEQHSRQETGFPATHRGAFNSVGQADANDPRSQGWSPPAQRADQRPAGANGVADADFAFRRQRDQQPTGQQQEQQRDQAACAVGNDPGNGRREGRTEHELRSGGTTTSESSGAIEWVTGADGKARRVKSGVRLLVDGFPNRVGLLRGFGNAIDPRPAAAFIASAMECMPELPSPPDVEPKS